ncbi:aspartate dehydrogenase [Ammoniphilus sp. CFH 90114]|uniref:aspartate dehydrogenase n=1 Tax=Ammoniphilus sp. CFH 90114 TaxID=2493665 RepID=UPI00100FAAEA|nr:aspartate dehydrogenase [Ammoniphilus sp. CFH 90114]RXT04859.1 aspartate dehydrogenase [Ammoniphilus sp. CFH 90114]
MLRVGLIGYGTIGKDTAQYIMEKKAGNVELVSILVRDMSRVQSDLPQEVFCDQPDEFFAKDLDIVVEGAGHHAVQLYAERALTSGSDFIVSSVGAFNDQSLLDRTLKAAEEAGKRLIVPSAAVGGLDRIAAGAVGPLDEITLKTSKPPKAWFGTAVEEQVDLNNLTEPVCVFEGNARESSRRFPESVNVSAALSLAGLGLDETKVQVFVDPNINRNVHEIFAAGKFGEIRLQIQNTPSPNNPKTGYIVAMSIAKVLKNLSTNLVIGC